MNKTIYLTGIVLGVTAILLGAFGAHGLTKWLNATEILSFETGVKYQMYHALFLLILGNLKTISEPSKKIVFYFILIGVLLFSFSIYILATQSITGIDLKVLGLLTPLGGILLILGWIVLGYRCYKQFN